MPRASRPLNTRLMPQFTKDDAMLTKATNATAPGPVLGMAASRVIKRAAGGEVAMT